MKNDVLDVYLDQVLEPVIAILKGIDPVVYGEHANAWIDLGWDVSSGDGEIVDMATSILEGEVTKLPDSLKHWLWWQTSHGKYEAEACQDFLSDRENDRVIDDLSEIPQALNEILVARLLLQAEEAYDEYVESSEDEEDDEEYELADEEE